MDIDSYITDLTISQLYFDHDTFVSDAEAFTTLHDNDRIQPEINIYV